MPNEPLPFQVGRIKSRQAMKHLIPLFVLSLSLTAAPRDKAVFATPEEAADNPDFAIQGEYKGDGVDGSDGRDHEELVRRRKLQLRRPLQHSNRPRRPSRRLPAPGRLCARQGSAERRQAVRRRRVSPIGSETNRQLFSSTSITNARTDPGPSPVFSDPRHLGVDAWTTSLSEDTALFGFSPSVFESRKSLFAKLSASCVVWHA